MGLCLIYGVTLTFTPPKTNKIKYIIFCFFWQRSCWLSAALTPAGAGCWLLKKTRTPLPPHAWQKPDILWCCAASLKPGLDGQKTTLEWVICVALWNKLGWTSVHTVLRSGARYFWKSDTYFIHSLFLLHFPQGIKKLVIQSLFHKY